MFLPDTLVRKTDAVASISGLDGEQPFGRGVAAASPPPNVEGNGDGKK